MLSSDLSEVKSGKQKPHFAPANALFMTSKMPRSKGRYFQFNLLKWTQKIFFYSNDKDI